MNPYLLINIKQQISFDKLMPSNSISILDLMGKLTHRLRVVCAVEAAKLVLPIWDRWAYKYSTLILTREQKEAPKKTIEIVEKWLDGNATIEEVNKTSQFTFSVFSFTEKFNYTARAAAKSASDAANSITTCINIEAACDAISSAAYAIHTSLDGGGFYNNWWPICYPLILKEFQDRYELLIKEINGSVLD